jgi:hypothetical protein
MAVATAALTFPAKCSAARSRIHAASPGGRLIVIRSTFFAGMGCQYEPPG